MFWVERSRDGVGASGRKRMGSCFFQSLRNVCCDVTAISQIPSPPFSFRRLSLLFSHPHHPFLLPPPPWSRRRRSCRTRTPRPRSISSMSLKYTFVVRILDLTANDSKVSSEDFTAMCTCASFSSPFSLFLMLVVLTL
jgi:hypothetical protein